MSRRTAVIEEFDDDTELPLPSQPLPNTGTRGAILQELSDDDDDSDAPPLRSPTAGPASPSYLPPPRGANGRSDNVITDITPYKKWTCVYPIYLDAKRPYGRGERRVPRQRSVWWPLSKDVADAAVRLGLGALHEVNKAHPRDWENPGRVRIQWKKDGNPMNPAIRTKKQLIEMLALQIQLVKPDLVPKPPYTSEPSEIASAPTASPQPAAPQPVSTKGKGLAKGKAAPTPAAISTGPTPASARNQPQSQRTKPPVPPAPWPPLASRVSPYSPALPSGVLVETVKAGMTQEGPPGIGGGGGGKGKRKVVRVRA
ncbi:hypothetical protein CERSUDRAFT_116869 [Gelatoporia subvermispora B]|uniref:Signal recognition particle SRP19 subunit n=1 Tax=Ceriporiopsis subvermispora (strain B) TaxID=914234 RepID=M2PFH6_CERS8|nr:hypothetical protein CERSUDRAFT_116869 [Gelatoporia subvermispora B]